MFCFFDICTVSPIFVSSKKLLFTLKHSFRHSHLLIFGNFFSLFEKVMRKTVFLSLENNYVSVLRFGITEIMGDYVIITRMSYNVGCVLRLKISELPLNIFELLSSQFAWRFFSRDEGREAAGAGA